MGSGGQALTLVLADEIDISRGDILCDPQRPPEVADQFAAHLIWMDSESLLPERTYLARFATAQATAQITDLVHQVDVNTLEHWPPRSSPSTRWATANSLSTGRSLSMPMRTTEPPAAFVLIDKFTNATVGAGVINFALRRASNIAWHDMKVDKAARAQLNNQQPCVLWFTGLSGSGKSTVADRLEQKLHAMGKRTYVLDGDNVRHGLNKDLGFTDHDRWKTFAG